MLFEGKNGGKSEEMMMAGTRAAAEEIEKSEWIQDSLGAVPPDPGDRSAVVYEVEDSSMTMMTYDPLLGERWCHQS